MTPRQETATTDGSLRAADGRVPGERGQATRGRLLDATAELLTTTSYRDIRVVEVARGAGTSPATFYQYFPDIESAVLELARQMADEGTALARTIDDAGWTGRDGYPLALRLVDAFLAFWDSHHAVLRVVDLAIVEGDARFRELRTRLLNPVTVALRDVIAGVKARGRHPDSVDPTAQAAVLVSMLAHVAEHQHGLEVWGVRTPAARESMARIVYWSVTAKRP